MIPKKQAKAAMLYTILGFIPLVSSFLLLPVNVAYLSTSDFGITALASIVQSYFTLILVFGLEGAVSRYYFDYNKTKQKSSHFLMVLLSIIVVVSVVLGLVLYFVGASIISFFWDNDLPFDTYGWYLFFHSVFLSLNMVLFQYYRMSENLTAATWLSLLPFVLSTAGGLIGVVYFHLGAFGSVAGKAIGAIIASVPFYLIIFLKNGLRLDFKILKDLYIYAYPIVLYSLIGTTSSYIDRLLLNEFFTLSELGVYNLAITIVSPIGILLIGYWNAVSPDIMGKMLEQDKMKFSAIEKYYDLLFLIAIISVWGIIAVINPVITNFTKPEFWVSYSYVPLLAFSFIGRAYYLIYSFGIFFYKKTIYLPFVNLISLIITSVVIYFLSQKLGIIGVCIGVSVSQFSQFILAYFIDRRIGEYVFPIGNTFILTSLSCLLIFINYVYVYQFNLDYVNVVHVLETAGVIIAAFFLYRRKLTFKLKF